MEYQVSARKYRPMSFSSVVGQEALTTTLKNAVKSGKLAHAFLFCGPRGVGKTTCARIFAKTINCETPSSDGEACGECESCRAFAEQRSYNIFELDAASNNSVENIKQLMEQTRIPPQVGKYKVFIIDEVHMLSTQAFNAFLKTLEEPPSYVIFILATTEKNKLLPTILSRCQIYDFDRMTVPNTVTHLKMVAEHEGYTYEEEALEVIAEKADGGMRDALSIFDQAASFCQGNITLEKVIKDLNLMDIDNYFQLVDLALQNKCAETMMLLNKMLSDGMDGGNIVSGLAEHVRNVMMAKDAQTIPLLEASKRYVQRYQEQAQKCSAVFLYKALQILTRCDLNYRQSSNKRLLVEITLIEVAQITQPADAGEDAPRVGRRLKSLFKKITLQQPKPAEQVAGAAESSRHDVQQTAERGSRVPVSVTMTETENAGMPSSEIPKVTAGMPKMRIGALGGTFGALKKKSTIQETAIEEKIENNGTAKPFNEEELSFQWMAMCNRMAQNRQYLGLATSMRNLEPRIVDFPNVEILVTNNILLDQLKQINSRIRATLAKELANSEITISYRLAENTEIKKVLTQPELFEKFKKQFSVFNHLVKELGLELM
ncbi:MAG: DNA polymerase III subunit gamma/tau [Bacteroidales bacterium]|nr:DNA polymerase III subunit gamma/tau [Bacteroidales bacterium]MCM1147960.1 DNA polymerase III subunit gamma/tau [Bacteroidales bacterium]MCM1206884.1 DNA polymerase III subunit gamma/tau [Bacillota bacterium]MCM1509517.1 DNA polymerase III subunit gamma/tau [Clostridium sp.]